MSSKIKDKAKPASKTPSDKDAKGEAKAKDDKSKETLESAKTELKEDKSDDSKKIDPPGAEYVSLEDEIKALRKGLNFSPNFDPTPPAPYPPPAFTEDLSFGDAENSGKPGSGRIKVQQLDVDRINSASSVNNFLSNLSPAKLSNSDSSVPRFGFASDPFDVLDSPKHKQASASAQRLANLGSKTRLESGSINKQAGGKEPSRTSSQAVAQSEKPSGPPNLSTLGYSLLSVPRNKIPADVLDDFVKQQRQREHDYFINNIHTKSRLICLVIVILHLVEPKIRGGRQIASGFFEVLAAEARRIGFEYSEVRV